MATPAWTKKEGKDPKGELNKKGTIKKTIKSITKKK